MHLNTLTDFPCCKKYYLFHPWHFFKHCIINIRNAWMRVTKGYCMDDVWSMHDWFCNVTSSMLYDLGMQSVSYPGINEWDTPDKWSNWLMSLSSRMKEMAYDTDKDNEYYSAYIEILEKNKIEKAGNYYIIKPSIDDDGKAQAIREKYFARVRELADEKQLAAKATMDEFSKGIVMEVFYG